MNRVWFACLVTAALVLGHLGLTAAETARFRYVAAIYADDKGTGLKLPEGVGCGPGGQVVVGDTGNNRLLRFTYRDKTLSGGGAIAVPGLSAPSRVHLNSKGEIYALDSRQRRIVHLGPGGEFKEWIPLDGVPSPATIVPKAFAIDPADSLYVLDVFSARVLVLNAQGKFLKALALPDGAGFGSELAVDFAGNVLLLDSVRRKIFSAAKGAAGFGPDGWDLAQSLATLPTSITASKGIVFVTEGVGSTILSYGRDGSFLARQLTMGWTEGTLNYPSQMCVNDEDEVFVADRDNSRLQVFQLIR